MSSEIQRGNKMVRPAFIYDDEGRTIEKTQCELLESCRNVMEDVVSELRRLNSTLNCPNFLRIPRSLRKIASNTAKPKRKPRS